MSAPTPAVARSIDTPGGGAAGALVAPILLALAASVLFGFSRPAAAAAPMV